MRVESVSYVRVVFVLLLSSRPAGSSCGRRSAAVRSGVPSFRCFLPCELQLDTECHFRATGAELLIAGSPYASHLAWGVFSYSGVGESGFLRVHAPSRLTCLLMPLIAWFCLVGLYCLGPRFLSFGPTSGALN